MEDPIVEFQPISQSLSLCDELLAGPPGIPVSEREDAPFQRCESADPSW